jgi:hypothetical protein
MKATRMPHDLCYGLWLGNMRRELFDRETFKHCIDEFSISSL